MSDITLRDIQQIEVEALVHIDKICKENNIKYYLRGGSVLGAVKYQGFVPWDDDIDIVLPRVDYEKLIEVCREKMTDKFLFVSYKKTQNAHCYFPRVILDKDYCDKNGYPVNNERGLVLIDILPLDGMPGSWIAKKVHIFRAYLYRVLASLWTIDVKSTVSMHGGKKQKLLHILYKLKIHHMYKQDDIYKKLDCLYSKYKYGSEKNAGMLSSSKLKKEIVPYGWWGEGTIKKYCGMNVYVPVEYDKYLRVLFGDNYSTYEPAADERKKSHLLGVE